MRLLRTPRLQLVKVVSRRNQQQRSGGGGDATGRKWGESAGKIAASAALCNAFCSSCTKPAQLLASCSARKINTLKEVVADRLRTVTLRVHDQTVVPGDNGGKQAAALGKSQSFKLKMLWIKGETENLGRSCKCLLSRFSGMFRLKKKKKKSGFRLRKWKISRKSSGVKSFGRIPSRYGPKLMMRKEEEESDGEEMELCKKRILMGDKCKPLNISGSLHYDKNGVLLPELLLPCE